MARIANEEVGAIDLAVDPCATEPKDGALVSSAFMRRATWSVIEGCERLDKIATP